MPAPLDTLQIVKRLKEAGFADPQAEALTIVFRDLRETDFSSFSTKADIQSLQTDIERVETRLASDIERVDAKLASDIERVETKLTSDIERVETRLTSDIERLEAKLVTEIGRIETKLVTEIGRLETKLVTEIGRLEAKLVTEIGRLESRLEVKIADSKVEIIRWVFGIAFAQAALILAVLRLFPGAHP